MAERKAVLAKARCMGRSLACLAVITFAATGLAAAQQTSEPKLTVSDKPLTPEQLAVYQVVLHGWMENELSTINLSIQTNPLPMSGAFDASECAKGSGP